jgi:hypothetical protein
MTVMMEQRFQGHGLLPVLELAVAADLLDALFRRPGKMLPQGQIHEDDVLGPIEAALHREPGAHAIDDPGGVGQPGLLEREGLRVRKKFAAAPEQFVIFAMGNAARLGNHTPQGRFAAGNIADDRKPARRCCQRSASADRTEAAAVRPGHRPRRHC